MACTVSFWGPGSRLTTVRLLRRLTLGNSRSFLWSHARAEVPTLLVVLPELGIGSATGTTSAVLVECL